MKKTISVLLVVLMIALTALPCFAGTSICSGYGDVNVDSNKVLLNDGVTIEDARLVLRYAIGLDPFSKTRKARADLDGNGKVNVTDARIVLRLALNYADETAPDHPVTTTNSTVGNPTDYDSEYNLLGTEKYVVSATVTSNSTSTKTVIARNGSNVYLEMSYSGMELGVLLKDGKTYMLTTDRTYSLEMTDKIYSAMDEISGDPAGTMKKEMASMTQPSSYSFPCYDLSNATKSEVNTISCPICGKVIYTEAIYTFGDDDNKTEVYMNGKELLKTVTYQDGKQTSVTEFDYVKAEVPDSYFALPSKSANRYPTTLVSGKTAIVTFFLKAIDLEELANS